MKTIKFNSIINEIPKLGTLQFRLLKESIEKRVKSKKISNILETPINEVNCPYCKSFKFIRWGKRSDLQRYKCKNCNKTFNSLTKTPLARLKRKGHWLDYSNCIKEGLTIRKAAKQCGIHKNTSFRWRHRFLQNSNNVKTKYLAGIIETHESKFKESFKGSKSIPEKLRNNRKDIFVIVSLDRNNNIFDITNKGFNQSSLNDLKKMISKKSILHLKNNKTLLEFSINNNISYSVIKTHTLDEIKNIDKVDLYLKKFTKWINEHFKGVATKYLENYVSWYRGLNEFKSGINALTILYRAKTIEKYRHQPKKVTQYVL